ncbi:MAG: EscU/YscU/HrcU family type III secretion system export apparatus switch protein [Oscillospiraceae bacterium]|nr:EscU/YscU/HrcU family type III secretion system export apparatus switch protein [Oscillospiraceae bacterium]
MSENKGRRIRQAVALEYQPDSGAPQVVASGSGKAAERIIEKAMDNEIPIHNDPELAHALNMLNIGDEIPQELYEVVAQILLHVADMDKKIVYPEQAQA